MDYPYVMMKYILIDVYTNKSKAISYAEFAEAKQGCEEVVGAITIWVSEEYSIIELPSYHTHELGDEAS